MSMENNSQKNTRKVKITTITNILEVVSLLPNKGDLLLWEWLEDLKDDIENFNNINGKQENLDTVFFFAIFDDIDLDLLVSLEVELKSKRNLFVETDVFKEFEEKMRLVGALLLYYLPENTPVTISEWREKAESGDKSILPALLRFLGQAFFTGDYDVCLQLIDEKKIERFSKNTFFIFNDYYNLVIIFLVWKRFSTLGTRLCIKMTSEYLWPALCYDIPIRMILEDVLAEEVSIDAYLAASGSWAENIKNSNIVLDQKRPDFAIKNFLEDFLVLAKKDDLNILIQEKYLNEIAKKNNWNDDFKNKTKELLQIFLHLRECDLFDFRGLLSDVVAEREKYHWKDVLSKDTNEEQKKEIKRYLTLLHRPWRTKMLIIVALESLNWKDEMILNRALVLNEIYEEVYGRYYGSLVYFDQKKGDWCLNKNFPSFLQKDDLNYN